MDKDYQEVLKTDESLVQDAVYLITDKMAELSKNIESVQRHSAFLSEVVDSTSNRTEVLTKEKERLEKGLTDLSHRLLTIERENERRKRRWQEFKDFVLGLLFIIICILALYGAAALIRFF